MSDHDRNTEWATLYRMNGGPFESDPRDMSRPDGRNRPTGYIPVDPLGAAGGKPVVAWHRLGPAVQVADKLMHAYYLRTMERLLKAPGVHGGRAWYPDETGILIAAVIATPPGGSPRLFWLGVNARGLYAAGALAISVAMETIEAGRR